MQKQINNLLDQKLLDQKLLDQKLLDQKQDQFASIAQNLLKYVDETIIIAQCRYHY